MAAAPLARAASLGLTQPVQTPSWPHRPQVPIPELMGSPFISSLKKQVARGPVTAEVRMAGSQMRGFFTMLGICSMEVPMPWLTSPPQRFSRKERTANPTMLAQQPATAAPPASPVSPSTEQMAAEEMGSVRAMPTSTDTRTPMKKGCSSVVRIISWPKALAAPPMGGAMIQAAPTPTRMVTMGVTRMSTFVSLLTALPTSAAMIATNSTASGPPAPPRALQA